MITFVEMKQQIFQKVILIFHQICSQNVYEIMNVSISNFMT
jgi:hypothetical protein